MKYFITPTHIKGNSVFAKKVIFQNELIGEYFKNFPNIKYTKNIFNSFDRDLGRYCNHSFNSNTDVKESYKKDGYDLHALNEIKIGEEILVNYVFIEELMNLPKNTFYRDTFNEEIQTFIIKNLI